MNLSDSVTLNDASTRNTDTAGRFEAHSSNRSVEVGIIQQEQNETQETLSGVLYKRAGTYYIFFMVDRLVNSKSKQF